MTPKFTLLEELLTLLSETQLRSLVGRIGDGARAQLPGGAPSIAALAQAAAEIIDHHGALAELLPVIARICPRARGKVVHLAGVAKIVLPPPRVLMLHADDPIAPVEHIVDLASRLRNEGVDVRLDHFDPAPRAGSTRWLEEEFEAADRIVLICTEELRRCIEHAAERTRGWSDHEVEAARGVPVQRVGGFGHAPCLRVRRTGRAR